MKDNHPPIQAIPMYNTQNITDTKTHFHWTTSKICKYLFLQVVVIAIMQQKTEDIPSINHGINATLL